ncbi:MAG: hypothetical protein MJA83_05625 [Gammaproteobacteria bacterium]|nr:hypothetical protein [Gammaproteobacteria bacterium]
MARENAVKVLHGHRYTVKMFATSTCTEVFRRIVGIAGPALGVVLDQTDATVTVKSLFSGEGMSALGDAIDQGGGTEGVFRAAIDALIKGLDQENTRYVIVQLAQSTLVQVDCSGGDVPLPEIYELHFQGQIGQWAEWLTFALRAQFGLFSNDSESEGGLGVEMKGLG